MNFNTTNSDSLLPKCDNCRAYTSYFANGEWKVYSVGIFNHTFHLCHTCYTKFEKGLKELDN